MTPKALVTLSEQFLPRYDVRTRHEVHVRASPAATYAALEQADLAGSPLAKCLLGARALPAAVLAGGEGLRRLRQRAACPLTLTALEAHGFRRLATDPPRALILGLAGEFWRPSGRICTPEPGEFPGAPAPGTARAVWSFTVREGPGGTTVLETETRVLCADAAVRRRFLVYWVFVRPASGLLRRRLLAAVRRAAERDGS